MQLCVDVIEIYDSETAFSSFKLLVKFYSYSALWYLLSSIICGLMNWGNNIYRGERNVGCWLWTLLKKGLELSVAICISVAQF